LSTSDDDATMRFDDWIADEFAAGGAFTALVVLVEVGERTVTPLASTYLNVIGAETGWPDIVALFTSAGVPWDGASFYPLRSADGGLLDDAAARERLRELEARVKAERLALNEGFFCDREGRRIMIEEVAAP
jgi:hypothetical protein